MKVEVTKKYRHGKTYVSGELKGAGVYDSDPDIEVDGIVYPQRDRALLMLTEAGDRGELVLQLMLSEEQVDHLRDVLYEVSKQMMVDRNRRVTQEKHARAGCVSRKTARYNVGEENGDDPMKPKLYSFKFHMNAYGDVGFNQIMAPSEEHAIEFAKDEFEGGTADLKVNVDTFKVVEDVNAYYDSFPLMD